MVVKVEKKFIEMITMKKTQEITHEGHKMMKADPRENNPMTSVPVSLS